MNIVLKSMAIVLSLIAGLQAMDLETNELSCFNDLSYSKEMTPEELTSHKMLLIGEHMKNMKADVEDIRKKIVKTFYEVSQPKKFRCPTVDQLRNVKKFTQYNDSWDKFEIDGMLFLVQTDQKSHDMEPNFKILTFNDVVIRPTQSGFISCNYSIPLIYSGSRFCGEIRESIDINFALEDMGIDPSKLDFDQTSFRDYDHMGSLMSKENVEFTILSKNEKK